MFGKNQIVGKSYFTKNPEATENGKLFVTSIFATIQGEGPLAGQPSVFVRLAKCNLDCSFCDTYFDDGQWMTTEDILATIMERVGEFYEISWEGGLGVSPEEEERGREQVVRTMSQLNLILTGGEPMLQQNLVTFIENVSSLFRNVQIETNGMLWQDIPDYVVLVVSPKCSEKTGTYFKVHDKIAERMDCMKFVVSADEDSPYHDIPRWAKDLANENGHILVYVSPMNVYNDEPRKSKELRLTTNQTSLEQRSEIDEVISFWTPGLLNHQQNQANHEYAARYAMLNGYTVNIQMHLYLSMA